MSTTNEDPGQKKVSGNGQELPPEDLKELPEEPQDEANRPSVAAASEKFKKYGAMRRDPKAEIVPVRKRLVNLPVLRSPDQNWFVRTSTNPEHSGTLPLFWDKGGDDNAYLVDEAVQDRLAKVNDNYCVLAITKQGSLFLWCTPLENLQGEWNSWHASAHDMKAVAAEAWVKVASNKQIGGYDAVDPIMPITQVPVFPDNLSWPEIVHLAFRRRLIEKEDHPIIRRIQEG
jgi:hypothetical protein